MERDFENDRKSPIYQLIYDIPEESALREVENILKGGGSRKMRRLKVRFIRALAFPRVYITNRRLG